MKKTLTLLAAIALCAAGAAHAQIQCWTVDGKRVCGDTPPPGAKTTTIKGPASGPAPAPAAANPASKDAKKGPMTLKEQEQDYRNRQAESKKAAEKAAQEEQEKENRKESCASAREYLRSLESGQRIPRTDAKGERYFMNDEQIAQEQLKTRQTLVANCGGG